MANSAEQRIVRKIFTYLGVIVVVGLVGVGSLLFWGYTFATSQVHSELAAQKIYFPEKGSPSLDPNEFPDLQQYAGQLVDDGLKAKAYANGFIGRHLEKIAAGKTYAEVSALAAKDPTNTKLQQQKASLFQGEMLRGILLGDGYAYWMFGMIALYASIGAFVGAVIVAIFTCYSVMRLRRSRA